MTLVKAMNRLTWRFSNTKNFYVNYEDKVAFNFIIEFINTIQSKTWQNNELVAKLFINEYYHQVIKYKCSPMDRIPQTEINRFLEKPLDWHFQRFTDKLNEREREKILPKLEKIDFKKLSNTEIKRLTVEFDGLSKMFSMEDLKRGMLQMTTEALRKYS